MQRIAKTVSLGLALVMAATSLPITAPAFAQPPGKEKNHGNGKAEHGRPPEHGKKGGGGGPGGGDSLSVTLSFNDGDRIAVRDYYGGLGASGHCPPGLAKKGNGCLPPGQAKKWMLGHPLPRDVVFYDLPHELVVRLHPAPEGYRYVRVAGDILMIAVGTGLVAAAIQDLAR